MEIGRRYKSGLSGFVLFVLFLDFFGCRVTHLSGSSPVSSSAIPARCPPACRVGFQAHRRRTRRRRRGRGTRFWGACLWPPGTHRTKTGAFLYD